MFVIFWLSCADYFLLEISDFFAFSLFCPMLRLSILKLLLMVYVDDFKMAGPEKSMTASWKLIREGLALDEPGPVGRCLGCHHVLHTAPIAGCGNALARNVRVMEYHASDFMKGCVTAFKKACGEPNMKLRRVDTPFLPATEGGGIRQTPSRRGVKSVLWHL